MRLTMTEDTNQFLEPRVVKDKLTVIGSFISSEAKKNAMRSGGSGQLANSITYKVQGNKVKISANTIYALIQELGGEIRPRKAKALAAPIDRESKGKLPADFPDLFPIYEKGKAPLLVVKNGDEIKPLFILLKSVTMRAHPYLRPALYNNRNAIMALLNG